MVVWQMPGKPLADIGIPGIEPLNISMKFDRSIFIGKFTQEANEVIHAVNEGLIQLEKAPQQTERLKPILRSVHTLKGSANILHLDQISQLTHNIEDVLTAIQDNDIPVTPAVIQLLFSSIDMLSACIQAAQSDAADALDTAPICSALLQAAQGQAVAIPDAREHQMPVEMPESVEFRPQESRFIEVKKGGDAIRVPIGKLDHVVRLVGEITIGHKKSEQRLDALKEIQQRAKTLTQALQRLSHHDEGRQHALEDALEHGLQLLKEIEHQFRMQRDDFAAREIAISELYDDVLNMRMLPLAEIFEHFPRSVRDMAKDAKKLIDIRIVGEETTLDKKIIEQLEAPLNHLLRNCVDHGIERPEERTAHGKSPTGLISISASHQSGHIRIEVTDDGQGIQREKLKARAIQRGMLTEEAAQTLSDVELLNLAFWPRLSTSELITDMSGRGVGMDIVKTTIETLKGTVALTSTPGKGTACVFTVPVSLTSLRSLIVKARDSVFAIPIDAIEETLHVTVQECLYMTGHVAIRHRNQLIYLVELGSVLQCRPPRFCASQEQYFVLIAHAQGKRVGLIVDAILDEQDVVVKPLPPHLRKATKMIAGAAISSYNSIILILHLPEVLTQIARMTFEAPSIAQEPALQAAPRILLVEDSINTAEIEKHILETSGFLVDVAHDGVEALEHLYQTAYAAIITDIEMPRMDGFTFTQHLRQLPQYASVPVIIVTSLARESDKKRGLQVGANAYITKEHFEQHRLLETIKSLV